MRLLMITRKVDKDDCLAGFVFSWVKAIGSRVSQLKVICLEQGNTEGLPNNIKIYPVRKKKINNVFLRKIRDFFVFQKLVWRNIKQVDGVFCHMNPEYTIAVWPLAKIFRKKIVSWYAHKQVSFRLRLVEKIANKILTPSKKSFRLPSQKLEIAGHGIDTSLFCPSSGEERSFFRIITIGRISPTKDLETLIKAVDILVNQEKKNDLSVEIIGAPGLEGQKKYLEALQDLVKKTKLEKTIKFLGPLPNRDIPAKLRQADLFVNLSNTGSLDKAVLEAMACGVLVVTSNEAFQEILPHNFLTKPHDYKMLAEKIIKIKSFSPQEKERFSQKLREHVVKHHNLENLTLRIVSQFKHFR